MKAFVIYLCFQFSCSLIFGQSNFVVTKSDSSEEKLIYLVQYKRTSYLLTLLKDTITSKIIVSLRKKSSGINTNIIRQRIESGVSLSVRPFTKGKSPIIYIEIGSNALYAHEIKFSEKIMFKKGIPLKGKYLNDYYNKFIDKKNVTPY
ncbi:MAG: hypothetical protein ABIN01_22360 [Ferruginibacter sp.]